VQPLVTISLDFILVKNKQCHAPNEHPTAREVGSCRVKTQSKEPQKVLDVKFCHKKLENFLFFWPFETMLIMAHYSFLTHMNVKKLKLKIHLI
jgi:hypothetical protein